MGEQQGATLERPAPAAPPARSRLSGWLRPQLVAPLALVTALAGVGGWAHLDHAGGPAYQPHPPSVKSLKLPGGPASAAPITPAAVALAPAAGRDPGTAVATYLAARQRGDDATAYALLAPVARQAFSTLAVWRAGQLSRPRPVRFTAAATPAGAGGSADVRTEITQQGRLDLIVGFVPDSVRATYRALRTPAGWRVLPDPVTLTPVLPSDAPAAQAAAQWLAEVSQCDSTAAEAFQVGPDLTGDVVFGQYPCTKPGNWRAGSVRPLVEGPRTQAFTAAYGSGVGLWARLVPVTGPADSFSVALAPVGGRWRVFGIIRDGAGGTEGGS